jgi:hypothetical protein
MRLKYSITNVAKALFIESLLIRQLKLTVMRTTKNK